jgi:amidase
LKPSRGRNPLGPRYGDVLAGLVAEHVVSRSVRDSAAVLDATCGPDLGDPYFVDEPERPYMSDIERDPAPLRVAVSTTAFNGVDVDPLCAAAARQAAELCAELGHHVVEAAPAVDPEGFEKHFFEAFEAFAAWVRIDWEERLARPATRQDFGNLAWTMAENGSNQSAGQHLKNIQELHKISRAVGRFFTTVDVLLTPTVAVPPLPLGSLSGRQGFDNTRRCIAFAALANVTGQPAMSVPLASTDRGLPLGVQFIGRFGDESTLFRLAGQLERAQPWAHRHPALSAFS